MTASGDEVTVDPAELADRPQAARRPRRGGAAARGPRQDSVGAAARAPRAAASPPSQQRRRAIGKSLALNGFVEVLPDAVPARGGLRRVGAARRRSAARHHGGAQSVGVRPAASGDDVAAGHAGGVGAQRLPRAPPTSRCSASSRSPQATPRTEPLELIPVDRRPTDDEIATIDDSAAAAAAARRRGADRSARTGGPVGTGTSGRGLRRLRGGHAIIGRACNVEFTLRAAQRLPWHPGRVRRGARSATWWSVTRASCTRR